MNLDDQTRKLVALAVDTSTTEEERRTAAVAACRNLARSHPYREPPSENASVRAKMSAACRHAANGYRLFLEMKPKEKRFIFERSHVQSIVVLLEGLTEFFECE